jgi:hypothetical protein
MSDVQTYTDRFGNDWAIRTERKRGAPKHVTFTCGDIRLVAAEEEADATPGPVSERVKDLFCDAERVLVFRDETWYVGYRTRVGGRNGRMAAGMCTRFRSESGEVRYSKTMLHFRHMSEATLCEQLTKAQAGRA